MKLAIIDLGTNSIRFDIYELTSDLSLQRLYRMKEMIRLGDDVFTSGSLNSSAKTRCFKVLDKIQAILKVEECTKTIAFATSALRSAKDAASFTKEIYARYDIKVEIISGKEEALLIAKAIINNEILPATKNLFVDIGGGSTEISVTYKNQILDYVSLDLGAARLEQIFRGKKDWAKEFEQYVLKSTTKLKQDFKYFTIPIAIGSSGTIRAIAKILKKADKGVEPFLTKDLNKLTQKLISLSREEILKIPALEEKRADIITSGALLYLILCQELGIEETYTTDLGLRDGILDAEIEYMLKG